MGAGVDQPNIREGAKEGEFHNLAGHGTPPFSSLEISCKASDAKRRQRACASSAFWASVAASATISRSVSYRSLH